MCLYACPGQRAPGLVRNVGLREPPQLFHRRSSVAVTVGARRWVPIAAPPTLLRSRSEGLRRVMNSHLVPRDRVGHSKNSSACGHLPEPNSFLGQGRHEIDATLDPGGEPRRGRPTIRADNDEAVWPAAGKFQRPNAGFGQSASICVASNSHHHRRSPDAAAHVATEHEAQAAHHSPLHEVLPALENLAHLFGCRRIDCHD